MLHSIGYASHYWWIHQLVFTFSASVTDATSHPTLKLLLSHDAAKTPDCDFTYFYLHEEHLRSSWRDSVTSLAVGQNDTVTYLLPWFLATDPKIVPKGLLHGLRCSLTASNPLGQALPHQVNLARNKELRADIDQMQPQPSQIVNTWSISKGGPKELGYTVVFNGTDARSGLKALKRLGRQYCQAALYCYHAEGRNLIMDVVPCFEKTAAVASQVEVVAVPRSEADPHGFDLAEPVPEAKGA